MTSGFTHRLLRISIGLFSLLTCIHVSAQTNYLFDYPYLLHHDSLSSSLSPQFIEQDSLFPSESEKSIMNTDANIVGEWVLGPCHAVCIAGQYAFIGCGRHIRVLNISDPSQPIMIDELETWGPDVFDIQVRGDYAYVACGTGMQIVDISVPGHIELAGEIDLKGFTSLVRISGQYAFVGGLMVGRVIVIDISDPHNPIAVDMALGCWDRVMSLEIAEEYLYIGTYTILVDVYDISDPENTRRVGSYPSYSPATDIVYANNYLFVTTMDNPRFRIADLTMPNFPQDTSTLNMEDEVYELDVKDSFAYLGTGEEGLMIVDFSGLTELRIVAQLDKPISYKWPWALTVDDNYAYMAAYTGLWVIDVSLPEVPVDATFYATGSQARDVAVSKDYAYVADRYAGLMVADISDSISPHRHGHLGTAGEARHVLVNDRIAFLATSDALLEINISDPSNPVELVRWPEKVNDFTIVDGLLLAARSDTGLSILNIRTHGSLEEAGFFPCQGIFHVDAVGPYAYLADSDDGLRIIDISEPSHPVEVSIWRGDLRYFQAVCVQDNFAYVAAENGLNTLDVADPIHPVRVGDLPLDIYKKHENLSVDPSVLNYYVYLNYTVGVCIIDVADPSNPRDIKWFGTSGRPYGMHIEEDTICLTDTSRGLLIRHCDLPAGEKGDLDRDGSINVSDILRTVNILTHASPRATSYELWAADFNNDDRIDVLDVVNIVSLIIDS